MLFFDLGTTITGQGSKPTVFYPMLEFVEHRTRMTREKTLLEE
mgnify:CR=1 FL=1